MSSVVHFSDDDWARTERDWSAWWEGDLARPLVLINNFVPPADKQLPELPGITAQIPFAVSAEEVAERVAGFMEAMYFYGDSFPRWWPNFGPGIAAGFLGSKVDTQQRTVWFEPLENVELADIHATFDPDNIWWKRVRDLTVAAAKRIGDRVVIAHTDIGGNLDILASLREANKLLLDLIDDADEVMRLVGEITTVWLRYYNELYDIIGPAGRGTTPWAPIWSPKRCYMLQCDLSYMFSPKMFERYVMPDLEACCNAMEHGFYHLDGKGEIPHLDLLLSLERLKGIQWIPGAGAPPPEEWLPLLKRIKDGGKLCQVFVSAEGAMKIVKELGGRGFTMQIMETMNEEKARDFLKALAAVDPDSKWEPR